MAFCLGEGEKAGLGGRRKYLEFTENAFELDFGIKLGIHHLFWMEIKYSSCNLA